MSIEKRLVLFCGAALLAMPVMAQNAPILRPGVWEVGGFVGASYGIDQTRVMGGGNVVYSANLWLMPFAEVSYFPGIGRTQTVSVPGIASATADETRSVPLTDFNAGFHFRIPIPKSRFIPYGVVSVGAIHTPEYTINATVSYPNPVIPTQTITQQVTAVGPEETNLALSFGGGIRYYATERLGFRVEAKAYKAFNVAALSTLPVFTRVAFGFFYQF